MKVKLIALDIDGTLLNDKKEVPEEVRESLTRARKEGIQIALLSGRMPYAVELIEKKLGFSCVKACNAGTCVILDSGKTIMDFLSADLVKTIYHEVAEKYQIPLWIYRERSWFVTRIDPYVENESRIIKKEPKVMDVDLLHSIWKSLNSGPNKILFATDPRLIPIIAQDLERYRGQELDFARSDAQYLEIFPKGADKGKALRMICEALRMDSRDVMAFGDQELDLPMLEAAGFAVAMGNAIPLLKDHADYVTTDNNQAGVAYALRELLGI